MLQIEGLSETTKSYAPLPTLPSDDSSTTDATLPTFAQALIPSQIVLIAYLDTERPLSEPKWVKSGDVHEWLKSMFGRMFWVAGDAADGWEQKIEVVDPDPVSYSVAFILNLLKLYIYISFRRRQYGQSLNPGL